MHKFEVRKTACFPAQHARFHFVHRIPSGRRPESADVFPTCLPIDLCCSAHMEGRIRFYLSLAIENVDDDAPAHSQLRIFLEAGKKFLKIIGLKRKIAIEFDDEIPLRQRCRLVSIVECLNHSASRFTKAAVYAVDWANPRIMLRGLVENLSGLV